MGCRPGPYFKNIFTPNCCPSSKRAAKPSSSSTHDDKYFDLADRIIKLDYGKLAPQPEPEPHLFSSVV